MKLLIIGGTGFIGRNLKNYFEKKIDIKVYAPTRQELDLFDDNLCFEYIKKLKPDIVIHSAVDITSVENTLKVFFNIYNANEHFGHMIQIGSGAEYDKRAYKPKMKTELNEHWEVLAEAIQTVLRKTGSDNAYEQLKNMTQGTEITQSSITDFVKLLHISKEEKDKLINLTPEAYTGIASKLINLK